MRPHKNRPLLPMLLLCVCFTTISACTYAKNPVLQFLGITSSENSPEMKQGLEEINSLIQFSCMEIYPRPTVAECIDRVKHGIGSSYDPHSGYMSKSEYKLFSEDTQGAFGGVGLEISKTSSTSPLTVVNVIEETPSQRAGLLPGDIISHIGPPGSEGVPTVSLKNVVDAVKLLRGTPNTTVNLRVFRKGVDKPMNFAVKREIINVVQIKGELIKGGEKTYALIENKQFNGGNQAAMRDKYLELVKSANGKLSGLIIRLENNPGGLLNEAYDDVGLFVDAQSIVLMKSNDSIEEYRLEHRTYAQTSGDITKGLPILVVVNGGSASASEIFSGAMKHFGRAVIAGTSRTFGKGIVQSTYPSSGGDAIKLTSSEYLIGSKTDWIPVQCVGVEPDILFEYPGVKNFPRPTECELSGHVNTGGPMLRPPPHRSVKEANPELYKAGEAMLEAYKVHMTPKLLAEEEKRKLREAE